MDIEALCEFLVEAKKATYAAGDSAQKVATDDGSTTLIFERGDWKYHDNYLGAGPFGGREVVFYKEDPIYIMTYYGQVQDPVADVGKVYGVLMAALQRIPEDKPYRGPEKYCSGELTYRNSFIGEVDNFRGEETISQNGKVVYRARYIGGFLGVR